MPKLFAIWILIMYPICFWYVWKQVENGEENVVIRFIMSSIGSAVVFFILSLMAIVFLAAVESLVGLPF